jgi:hypothetical protein
MRVTIGWLCVLYEGGEVLQTGSLLYIYSPTTRYHTGGGCRVAAAQPSPSLEDVSTRLAHGVNNCTLGQIERTELDKHVPLVPLVPLFVLALAIAGHNRTKGPSLAGLVPPPARD